MSEGTFSVSPPLAAVSNYAGPREAAGLVIERAEEWWGDSMFTDVGALIY